MHPSVEARKLISQGKLRDASIFLDSSIAKTPENDDLWYLRAIVSLKLNNYDNAHECLEHAISIKTRAEYFKLIGMAYLEMFEIDHSLEAFLRAIELDKKDAENYIYVAICLIMLDDPKSKEFVEKAYVRDKAKTKKMLKEFYSSFFATDFSITSGIKKEIEKKIDSIN